MIGSAKNGVALLVAVGFLDLAAARMKTLRVMVCPSPSFDRRCSGGPLVSKDGESFAPTTRKRGPKRGIEASVEPSVKAPEHLQAEDLLINGQSLFQSSDSSHGQSRRVDVQPRAARLT